MLFLGSVLPPTILSSYASVWTFGPKQGWDDGVANRYQLRVSSVFIISVALGGEPLEERLLPPPNNVVVERERMALPRRWVSPSFL